MSEQTTWCHRAKKSARHVFMFSSDQYKKARQVRFSTAGCVCSTQTRVDSHPAVGGYGVQLMEFSVS